MTKIIGFDGSRAFTEKRTGTETYSYQLLKALAKIDQKNHYKVYIKPGVKVEDGWPGNFSFTVINWPRLWTQVGLALQTFVDHPDILFVPAHTLPLIRKPGLKTVLTVHDLGSEYLPSMHQLKQRLYLGLMQRFQLKSATTIISVSNSTKVDLIKKIGLDKNKIKVVYEGFDKNLFQPIKNDILVNSLIQYKLTPGKYLLFIGTVQPRKSLERLIKAFSVWSGSFGHKAPVALIDSNFADLKLVIVGNKGWLSEEIYHLPKKLGIEERVKFLGYVPEKDLPILYSGAIALTFPSLFEGFGLPILEAQACGCPVLTSNVSSMPEVAGQGAIYVNPYSIDDIVKGVVRLQAIGFRQQVIQKGFENIRRFSWEKCAKETLQVLEEVKS